MAQPAPLPAPGEQARIRAVLTRLIFSSDGGGPRPFSVWAVEAGGREVRAAAGIPAEAWGEPGDEVEIAGEWREHPRHGLEIFASEVRRVLPRDAVGVARWLARRPGVGPATAEKVVAALGPSCLEEIARDPSALEGLHLARPQKEAVAAAAALWRAEGKRAEARAWLHRAGLGPARAEAALARWGPDAPEVLSWDPWQLVELDGVGFATADGIAMRLGADPASPGRLAAALLHCLGQAAWDEGHVWVPRDELLARALDLLRRIAESTGYGRGRGRECRDGLPAALAALAGAGKVVVADRGGEARAYLPGLAEAEAAVRSWLARRAAAPGLFGAAEAAVALSDPSVRGALDAAQLRAAALALASPASVLTGGPGTGKTTVTRAVAAALARLGVPRRRILLCAPTGRAARRLSEATGLEAKTVHRLLEYRPGRGFGRNRRSPLDGDFVILDEASMADVPLLAALLEAVPEGAAVLFVGDADQLPPVGPGAPFHEVVRRGLLPAARLARVYRQGEGSAIALNARRINAGEPPAPFPGDAAYRQAVYPRPPRGLPDAERSAARLALAGRMAADAVEAARGFLEEGYSPDDVQVLAPVRRGPAGAAALNALLGPVLNPRSAGGLAFRQGSLELRPGDRVMHLRNDYRKGVFNGEIGKVAEILAGRGGEPSGFLVEYDDGDAKRLVEYGRDDCFDVAPAWAATVHKAQGCEFPAVVFVATWDGYLLLKRNMLYTAVTRARERLAVLAEEGTLGFAAATADDALRRQDLG